MKKKIIIACFIIFILLLTGLNKMAFKHTKNLDKALKLVLNVSHNNYEKLNNSNERRIDKFEPYLTKDYYEIGKIINLDKKYERQLKLLACKIQALKISYNQKPSTNNSTQLYEFEATVLVNFYDKEKPDEILKQAGKARLELVDKKWLVSNINFENNIFKLLLEKYPISN